MRGMDTAQHNARMSAAAHLISLMDRSDMKKKKCGDDNISVIKLLLHSKYLDCAQILRRPQCWSAVGKSQCAQEESTGSEAITPTGEMTCKRVV